MKYLSTFLFLLSISICNNIEGQHNEAKITTISMETGIDGLEMINFFTDNDSKIWIQSETSINICSGKNIEVLKYGKELSSNQKLVYLKDQEKFIDLFYENEFSFFDRRNKLTHKINKIPLKLDSTILWKKSLVEKDSSLSFIGYKNDDVYVYHFSTDKITNFQFSYQQIKQIIPSKNGYWIKTNDLNIYHISTIGEIKLFHEFPKQKLPKHNIKQHLSVFHEDGQGRLWQGINGRLGLLRKEPNKMDFEIYKPILNDLMITSIWEDNNNNIIFGGTSRLKYVQKYWILNNENVLKPWDYLSEISSIPSHIKGDNFEKSLMMGTFRDFYFLQFAPPYLKYYGKSKSALIGEYGNLIRGLDNYSDSILLVTSESNKSYRFNMNTTDLSDFYLLNKDQNIFYSEIDTINEIIWNTVFDFDLLKENLVGWDIKKRKQIFIKEELSSKRFTLADSGELFFSSIDSSGLVVIGRYNYLNLEKKLIGILDGDLEKVKSIFHFYFDKEQNVLFFLTLNNGLFWIDLNDNSIHEIWLSSNFIYGGGSIEVGRNNELYISTDIGVFIVDKITKIVKSKITKKDGLSYPIACNVLEDKHNNLWISTFSGLNFVNRKTNRITTYYKEDGLPFGEFNHPSAVVGNNGKLYFGSGNGLVEVDPKKYYAQENNFSISFQKIHFKDNNIDSTIYHQSAESIVLTNSNNRSIDIKLANSDWGNFDQAIYFYKIENEWVPVHENQIILDRLNVGNYQIQIKGISRFGKESINQLQLNIEITQPFYRNPWYIGILAIALSGFLIYWITKNIIDKKNQDKRNELEFEKRVSQLQLQALQAQMNPHFIFNAISAIQQYLYKNDSEKVDYYLNEFARLMRLILESSKSDFISLKSEIELISLYTDLEKIRFNEKFDIQIDVDPEIEIDFVKIPTMIIQPYIENAINHGLFHKDGKGHLLIKITGKKEKIEVIVQDDGIGRKEAQRIKNKSIHKHKSRAMQIINERMNVLKVLDDYDLSIQIIDLFQSNQQANGTKVVITFPESSF